MLHNIRTLIKLANDLDQKGLYKEADLVDQTLNKLAASYVHDDNAFTGDIGEATRSAREVAATPPRGYEKEGEGVEGEELDMDDEDIMDLIRSLEEGDEDSFTSYEDILEQLGRTPAGVERFQHDNDIDPDIYEGADADEEGVEEEEEEEYEYDDEEDEGEFYPGTGARFKP